VITIENMAAVVVCEQCSYGYYVKVPLAAETTCENCGHINQTPVRADKPRPLGVAVTDDVQLTERVG
jgi:hypothetical protein